LERIADALERLAPRQNAASDFDSADAFASAFGPHAQEILADIPNYTNTQPTIQISDVKM